MTAKEWIETNAEGLGLLWKTGQSPDIQDMAIDAYLELMDLQRESWGEERIPVLAIDGERKEEGFPDPVQARIDEERFVYGHEYEPHNGKADDSTHQCRRCGVLVAIAPDGKMDEIPGKCSGRLGVYSYVVARTRKPDRSLDDCNLGFVWNRT